MAVVRANYKFNGKFFLNSWHEVEGTISCASLKKNHDC